MLFRALQLGEKLLRDGEHDCETVRQRMRKLITSDSSSTIDYVSIADGVTLQEAARAESAHPLLLSLAVRFGTTRLIDNVTVVL